MAATFLSNTKVRRGGQTAHYWYEIIHNISVYAASELHIRFSMSSKGGGTTNVQMEIRPEDFSTLVEYMCLVDRRAAMEAMAVELGRQVVAERKIDEDAILKAKAETARAISSAASRKWNPFGVGKEVERARTV